MTLEAWKELQVLQAPETGTDWSFRYVRRWKRPTRPTSKRIEVLSFDKSSGGFVLNNQASGDDWVANFSAEFQRTSQALEEASLTIRSSTSAMRDAVEQVRSLRAGKKFR